MSLRAIAFHKSVSAKKMEELFKSESNQLFATTDVAQCKKCGEQYAVFLPSIDDAQNGTYVADLEDRISKGCNKGTHSEVEIRLVVNP